MTIRTAGVSALAALLLATGCGWLGEREADSFPPCPPPAPPVAAPATPPPGGQGGKASAGTPGPEAPVPGCPPAVARSLDTPPQGLAALLDQADCLAVLAEAAAGGEQLRLARQGRELAARAVALDADSGRAHYLLAKLTGLVAEESTLKALSLVPEIEREARAAAALEPAIDQGGPDRILGELYLRAPGFPLSIGDPFQAAIHFRRAVELAPDVPANHLGLAEALLETGEYAEACRQLQDFFKTAPAAEPGGDYHQALELLGDLCRHQGESPDRQGGF